MSSTGTYLGPHIKTGPSSYLLGPIPITGHLPTMTSMYMGNVAWGLYDGPRRGEGSGSGKLNPLTPFMWDDFVGEHKYLKIVIDEEYTGVFNKLSETVKNEIEQKNLWLEVDSYFPQSTRLRRISKQLLKLSNQKPMSIKPKCPQHMLFTD